MSGTSLTIAVFLMFLFQTFQFVCCLQNLTLNCKDNERKALLEFRDNLSDPSGMLFSWNGVNCCRWIGVSCSKTTGHVIKLDLHGDKDSHVLGGEISPSLLQLNHLSHLDLSMNSFEGTQIPHFLGSLAELRHLDLASSSFNGRIPSNIGKLSGLQYLDLSSYYTGSVENDLGWLSSLSSLKYLNLQGVDFKVSSSHWLQIINKLPSLQELNLSNCGLTDLPVYPVNLTFLSVLDLSYNGFNSSLPSWLFNLTKLRILNLEFCSLHGVIPPAVSELTSLESLNLYLNYGIQGPLPKGLGSLCKLYQLSLGGNAIDGNITEVLDGLSQCTNSSLETLELGNNKFSGNLPASLCCLSSLRYLSLSQNSFTGSIPPAIGNLTSLEQLDLSFNAMSGMIPESLGQLKSIAVLNLYENSWVGVVTEAHLRNLSSLQQIVIGRFSPNVSLVFNISSNWLAPFHLTYVKIQGCQLGPNFPSFLRNQSDLERVIINYNKISDVVPDWFIQMDIQLDELDVAYNQLHGRVPNSLRFNDGANVDLSSNNFKGPLPLWSSNLTTLYLRDNRFSGHIPENIGTALPFLTDLDISRNGLTGKIPVSIGNMTGLSTLVISSNYLDGEIPDFWANLSMLYIVDMSNNRLSGSIPDSIGFLTILKFLFLSNNNLTGTLPSRLRNCPELVTLDLSDNSLSGSIPPWIGLKMQLLLILSLSNNSFTGKIPPEICNISALHLLDISKNNLSGMIPDCVGNLTGFTTEFSPNDFLQYQGKLEVVIKGRKLQYEGTLYLVNSIDLSRNNLSGNIPQQITSLVRLGTLNLSMNHLTGEIPPDIGRFERIETLDLSDNQLSGHIPQGMASLNFLNHLNLSYNNLSGQIPTGYQIQTLQDRSIFEGNPFLCGAPLDECDVPGIAPSPRMNSNEEDTNGDELDKLWLWLFISVGYFLGFGGICGSLALNRWWRALFFYYAGKAIGKLLPQKLSNKWWHDFE